MKRKLAEIGSILYRRLLFPFKRITIETGTGSVLKQGSYLNKGTVLQGKNYIGRDTVLSNVRLGFGSYVSDGGDLSNTKIGKYTSIGPEVRTVLGKHPVDSKRAALHPAFNSGSGAMGYTYLNASDDKGTEFEEASYLDKEHGIQIVIGNDVWIGRGVMILEGVTIGDGTVIGAGAVVTKDTAPYGIYAGVPARKLRDRFDKDVAKKLLKYQWWNKSEAWIKEHISCFSDVRQLISVLEEEKA